MKKILALLLSIMMVFALVACNNTEDPDNSGGGGGGSGGGGGGDPSSIVNDTEYDPTDPEQYIYRSVFANSPYKDQWDTGRYGADVSGVWDIYMLKRRSIFMLGYDTVILTERQRGYVGCVYDI